jgi:hypothetical protein
MKQRINTLIYLVFLIGLLSTFQSCKKNTLFSSSNITFSADTLVFDTLLYDTTFIKKFTNSSDLFKGNAVQNIKIYNPDGNALIIEEIELMGGVNSPFRLNLDGTSGKYFVNKKIGGKDSLFLFVDLRLNVIKKPSPNLIIQDSIRVKSNGKNQYLQMLAWGQDAYFHYKDTLKNNDIWKNDKPHVIVGHTIIEKSVTLDIQQGCKIHLYNNSVLYIKGGALNMNGTLNNKIIVQGTRPESSYQKIAGQYYGIYFHEALPSRISYAHIKNGTSAIHIYSRDASNNLENTVTIENTIIENNSKYGVLCFANPKILINNTLIFKNQLYSFFVLQGADFSINHSNILGYGPSTKDNIAFALKNYYTNPDDQLTNIPFPIIGTIKNSVIYGFKPNEYILDTLQNNVDKNSITLQNCLIKLEVPFTNSSVSFNTDPNFINISQNNFRFISNSPLNNSGIPSSTKYDIEGKKRSIKRPDIGAYEID